MKTFNRIWHFAVLGGSTGCAVGTAAMVANDASLSSASMHPILATLALSGMSGTGILLGAWAGKQLLRRASRVHDTSYQARYSRKVRIPVSMGI